MKLKIRRRWLAEMLAVMLGFSLVLPANAQEGPVMDETRSCSLTIYKYDRTKAAEDGVEERFITAGEADPNAKQRYEAYVIPGVEFGYLRIGDVTTRTSTGPDSGAARVEVLYGLDESAREQMAGTGIVSAGDVRYSGRGRSYFSSDTLIKGLSSALSERPTAVKSMLEDYVRQSGQRQSLVTDENGRASVSGLAPGLYLVAETAVPEDVVSTVEPFFISLPMTNREGTEWIYDVTVYPKNRTGMPELTKEVAEAGEGGEESRQPEGYGPSASASEGDLLAYRITSRMPAITSSSTYLTEYTFVDSLSGGISYRKGDVSLAWYGADGSLKETWRQAGNSGMFTVDYEGGTDGGETMRIRLTQSGLSAVNHVFSEGRVEITYQARLNSDPSAVCGDSGNPNEVELIWRRTNQDYYDTLKDECRVYTYGLALEKQFQTGSGSFREVKFRMKNETDGYYVAAREEEEGVYYVTGGAPEAEGGTGFIPNSEGKLWIFGLEGDEYELTEVETADGYLLLKEAIRLTIRAEESGRERTGTALVNEKETELIAWGDSTNALAPLVVVNQPGFRIPLTGDKGMFFLPSAGLAAGALALILLLQFKRKRPGKERE